MVTVPDLAPWGIPPPTVVRDVDGGTNNAVRIVDDRYVVRTYQNLSPDQIAAEHRLVTALAEQADLPFAVPVPIPARDGRTAVGATAVFPLISGRIATRDDLASIELAAAALCDLLRVMAELPLQLAPWDLHLPLDRLRPEITDLDALRIELETLLPGDEGVAWFAEHIVPLEQGWAALVGQFPVQLVHGDFSLSNVLIDGGRVTGVLDFEISGSGTRIGDVVAATSMAAGFGIPGDLDRLAAFQRGFARHGRLDASELAAFPVLLRHRALGAVVWRAGRWRRGHASIDEVSNDLADGLALERWLSQPANLDRLHRFG